MTWEELGPVLQAIGIAEAAEEKLTLATLSRDLAVSEEQILFRVQAIEAYGLAYAGWGEIDWPMLRGSGRHYLAAKGQVDTDVLGFLPLHIDDLNARRALLKGGTVLVDEFRYAINNGRGREAAQEISPPAFAPLIDETLALDLFAAAVALMARLSAGDPAGCVAEEIVAVSLIERAEDWLEMEHEQGMIDGAQIAVARASFEGLFSLFQDDDVRQLFSMKEPADAAVGQHDPINVQLGVVDQRIEAWFQPFGGIPLTGYLHEDQAFEGNRPPS